LRGYRKTGEQAPAPLFFGLLRAISRSTDYSILPDPALKDYRKESIPIYSYNQPLNDPRIFTLNIHEVRHLQQGFFTALSVYGELEAWQYV
jgi:hypothetical protein